MLQVARAYLQVRENQASYYQSSSTSWLAQAQPLMTTAGFAALQQGTGGGSGGYAYVEMHHKQWKVDTQVTCQTYPDAGPVTATSMTISCGLTDTTVTATGSPVPQSSLPNLWPYGGVQPTATLQMQMSGSSWLVASDETGQVP